MLFNISWLNCIHDAANADWYICVCVCSLVKDVDLKFLSFTAFGKNVPKGMKMSPDSFIQIALQLASYRYVAV